MGFASDAIPSALEDVPALTTPRQTKQSAALDDPWMGRTS